jgi:hypothetical protein
MKGKPLLDTAELRVGTLPGTRWYDDRGDGSRLRRIVTINDTFMHLDAIEVQYLGDDRTQVAVSELDANDFALLCQLGSEGPFETTDIDGRTYVLVATPFT